jgi:signal transduction histidine kinase
MVLAVLADVSAGMSPGRDVVALTTRLDAIGWDDHPSSSSSGTGSSRPMADPVRVTSFDVVGELFRNLERLRARLAEDVGTYQRALDRTHAVDAAKREFLAAVSHELRTPLDSIHGLAQQLLASDLSEAQAEDIRLILAGGAQLRELIDDILDISMIESGELELRFGACDIVELVDGLVDIHQAQVRGAVTLAAEHPRTIPPMICDRKRVGQVLTNLLSNAIKFTEAGRVSVTVSHASSRASVEIAVSDTGVGIAETELEAIFEEYEQVGARKRKLKGTGLGLAIARRIAEAHGGTLVADSKLGVGSTFTLRLPLAPDDPSTERAKGSAT